MAKTEYLRERELAHVLALLTPENELVMRTAIHTGLRIGDVLALRNPVRAQFWITEEKTGKRRRVNLTKELMADLNRNADGSPWIFPGRSNRKKHRTRQAVWADCKRARIALRLPVNFAPHSGRKIYAVEMMRKSRGDMSAVQRAMNHSDQAVTMLYAMAEALYTAKYDDSGGRVRRRKSR